MSEVDLTETFQNHSIPRVVLTLQLKALLAELVNQLNIDRTAISRKIAQISTDNIQVQKG